MTMTYPPKTFNIPALPGLSEEQIKVHLGLYEGYVKQVNFVMSEIAKLKESGVDQYVVNELRRRFAFEFDGMRMHEYYFEQFERSSTSLTQEGALVKAASEKYGSSENFIAHVKEVASSRGIGWAVVYADPRANTIHTTFVGDHELGQLAGLPIILALDLWEHAYLIDYRPATKKDYVDAFFANVNWSVVERRFDEATKMIAA